MTFKALPTTILSLALALPIGVQAQPASALDEAKGPVAGLFTGAAIGGPAGAVVGALAGAFIGHIEIQKDALSSAEEKLAASESQRQQLAKQLQQHQSSLAEASHQHQQTLIAASQDWDNKRQSLQENFAFCMQFRTGSASLEPRYQKQLNALAMVMQTFPEFDIQVAASADKRGSEAYNLKLKQQRAQSVIAQLISAGVDANRIQNADNNTLQPNYSVEDVEGLGFDRFAVISFVPSAIEQQPVLVNNVQP